LGDVERVLCRVHAKLEVKVPHFLACVSSFKSLAKILSGLERAAAQSDSTLLQRLLTLGSADMPDFRARLESCTSFWSATGEGLLEIKGLIF
jgi:hypothetical protein